MDARHGNAVRVLHFRVDIDVVRVAAQTRGLHREAHRRRIAALDLALEIGSEAFDAVEIPRKLAAPAAGIHGVAPNEFLLVRVGQILPARHPGDG